MTCIDVAALDGVVGGGSSAPNVTDVRTKDGQSYHQELTDYGFCAKTIKDGCNQANTSWLWGTDTTGANKCVDQRLVPNCGLPPSGSPPQ